LTFTSMQFICRGFQLLTSDQNSFIKAPLITVYH